ncbi:7-carboxy-7-deazaguanine synthase QueE [Candidatus Trichorickettsia mobilis]|uniref:7-carboxy-7-deazaguanine synthase QueE n=1 Tax=Candidatus Trichorickettsia mobilis TaxID=1346319 RepID=UPI00293006A4|nr:7-carboxy-7-deazaguanine synthase QueE [Candidatus Trichorickettsia mobilis]
MFGQNPKRSVVTGDGSGLEVKSIFKTLQGEGPLVGMPAVFVRLGGCNLACKFCDTDFEDFQTAKLEQIIQQVMALSVDEYGANIVKLVVITGGEPLRQPIELCCQKLIDLGFTVQIETNGTLHRALPKSVLIVCSPKAGANGYSRIREDLLPHISAIKFLVAKNIQNYSDIAEIGQSEYNIPVFIQPIDQENLQINNENTKLALELALRTGYRVSMQLHKIWGIE